jgi:hypothetical protein
MRAAHMIVVLDPEHHSVLKHHTVLGDWNLSESGHCHLAFGKSLIVMLVARVRSGEVYKRRSNR